MAKANKNSLRLDADFPEDVVGFALESFLTTLSFPRRRFSIEPFSRSKERWLGADARLVGNGISGFRPFYMQFKRPSAYPDYSTSRIIVDRKNLGQTVAPRTLFFSLQKKNAGHRDFQHNVLFRLRSHLIGLGIGDAAYVCPMFLDRLTYRQQVHWAGLLSWPFFWKRYPFNFEEVIIEANGREIRFDQIPILAEHVSIPPHDVVTTANHSYSFTENGDGVCFHSPKFIENGASSLGKFLSKISNTFLSDNIEMVLKDDADAKLKALVEAVDPKFFKEDSVELDPIGSWLHWGHHLEVEFGIRQFALVKWKN